MKLYVARHADAGGASGDPVEERDRPLQDDGLEMVKGMAKFLANLKKPPKVIFASNYERTKQTADIVGEALGIHVNLVGELTPHMPLAEFLQQLLDSQDSKRIMWVGHTDNITPLFNQIDGTMGAYVRSDDQFERETDAGETLTADGDFPFIYKAECRVLKVDRGTGYWECVDRWCPSDIGEPDEVT